MTEAKATKGNGAESAAPVKALPTLRPDRTFCAEQKVQPLIIFAPEGLTPENAGNPAIWQSLSHMLQPFSVGWLIGDGETWAVEFLVRSNLPARCSVVVLRKVDLPEFGYSTGRTLPEGLTVKHGGAATGWVVTREDRFGNVTVLGKGVDHPEWQREEDVIRWTLDHASVRQPYTGNRRFGS